MYWPATGGAAAQIGALSERLARRGHQVTVITLRNSDMLHPENTPPLPAREIVNGVAVYRWNSSLRLLRGFERLLKLPASWRLLSRVLSTAHIRGLADGPLTPRALLPAMARTFDVATFSNYYVPGMAYPLLLARSWRGYPFVGIPLLHTEAPWSRSPATIDLLRRSDALLANTEHEQGFLESIGYPPEQIEILGGGVDPAAFRGRYGQRVRSLLGIADAPVVGFVGRLDASKGVATLIEAMRFVWPAHPEARLLLAGHRWPPGSEADREVAVALERLSADQRQHVIRLQGFPHVDTASLFDAMDVLAMPSTAESFGMTFLEAWMCEKPVIGARIGAVECVIDHGADGLLVPPAAPAATADAINTLLGDPDRRRRMGQAGRRKTLARFTWDRLTDVTEALYDRLAAGRRRPR